MIGSFLQKSNTGFSAKKRKGMGEMRERIQRQSRQKHHDERVWLFGNMSSNLVSANPFIWKAHMYAYTHMCTLAHTKKNDTYKRGS